MSDTYSVVLCSVNNTGLAYEDLGIQSISAYLNVKNIKTTVYYYTPDNYDYALENTQAKIIGFNVYPTNYHLVNSIIKKIKNNLHDAIIIVGGQWVTLSDDIFELMPDIDFAVRGEGEITAYELFSNLLENKNTNITLIDGISYKSNGSVYKTANRNLIQNLDTLPWPTRVLAEKKQCQVIYIESARGCTGTCGFCSACKTKWRAKSIKYFVDEMEDIVNRYDIDVFSVTDSSFDNPHQNVKRMEEFCKEVISRKFHPKLSLFFRSNIYRVTSDNFWDTFTKAGLCSAFVGIESFDDGDLRVFSKPASVMDNIQCVKTLRKRDFQLNIGLIYFHPYVTYQSLKINNHYLHENELTSLMYQFNFLQILRGTDLYKKTIADGLYTDRVSNLNEWRCKDELVEKLVVHFKQNIMSNKLVMSTIYGISNYFNKFEKCLYYTKQEAVLTQDENLTDLLYEAFLQMRLISIDAGDLIYHFFDRYIDLFFEKSSNGTIDTYTNEFIQNFLSKKYDNRIKAHEMSFFMKCLKDKKYRTNTAKYIRL